MRVVIILLLGISACAALGKFLFAEDKYSVLQKLFYGLAIAQLVMLVYILFLSVVQSNSLL